MVFSLRAVFWCWNRHQESAISPTKLQTQKSPPAGEANRVITHCLISEGVKEVSNTNSSNHYTLLYEVQLTFLLPIDLRLCFGKPPPPIVAFLGIAAVHHNNLRQSSLDCTMPPQITLPTDRAGSASEIESEVRVAFAPIIVCR